MPRLLATSDVHIHPYPSFSTYDEEGVPSRLKDFALLGEDTGRVAMERKCDAIVVTGDISHSANIDPQTAFYIKEYFQRMRAQFPVTKTKPRPILVLPGQHDQSSKSLTHSAVHTILTKILEGIEGLELYTSPGTYVLGTKNPIMFNIEPWDHNKITTDWDEPAEVYLGHGIVANSKDVHGYNFVNGIDPDELMERYDVAIIGDLHSGQTFWNVDRSRCVLVPGTPIQTSFKDDPNCGLWIIDVEPRTAGGERSSSAPKLEFIPITDVRPGTYHRFIHVRESELEKSYPENVHVSIVRESEAKARKVKEEHTSAAPESAKEVAIALLKEGKYEDTELARNVLDDIFAGAKTAEAKEIPQTVLERIIIDDFLSIEHLDINLEEYFGELLLVGSNGTGKTTLAEAMYFLFTGKVTKDIAIGDLSNEYTGRGYCVAGYFTVDGVRYHLERSRVNGPELNLSRVLDNGELVALNKSSMKETQTYVENLINVSPWWISLMCYFSTNSLVTFSNLGGSDQNDLLGVLVGSEMVESYRASAKKVLEAANEQYSTVSTTIRNLTADITNKSTRIRRLQESSKQVDHTPVLEAVFAATGKEVTSLSDARKVVSPMLEHLEAALDTSIIQDADTATNNLREAKRNKESSEDKQKSLETKLQEFKRQYAATQKNECPTCHQQLKDDEIARDLMEKIRSTNSDLQKLFELSERYDEEVERLTAIEAAAKEAATKMVVIKTKYTTIRDLDRRISNALVEAGAESPEAEIRVLENQIAEIEGRLDVMSDELKGLETKSEYAKSIGKMFDRNGPVMSQLTVRICHALQYEMNNLTSMSDVFDAKVTPGKNASIAIRYGKGAKYTAIGALSGGERRLADIVMMVAIINVFSRRYKQSQGLLGMMVADEIFSHLDPAYGEIAFNVLTQCMSRLKMVITHDNNLQSYFHQIIKVKKNNGCSEYLMP